MDRKIIITKDKSKTLLIPSLNETYHSSNGAYQEAMHVFEKAGLDALPKQEEVNVFEMGFGTGLNALLSLNYTKKHALKINYFSIDNTPLPYSTLKDLNYVALFTKHNLEKEYDHIIKGEWNEKLSISPSFTLTKIQGELQSLDTSVLPSIDIVFYDAFGPRINPELWTVAPLSKMYDLLKPSGIFVTYCAQGQFKRNLKSIGFDVESLPGPPGKREMTRGIKIG